MEDIISKESQIEQEDFPMLYVLEMETEEFSLEIFKDHAHLSPFIKETIFIGVLRAAINVKVNVVNNDDSIANNILLSKTNVNVLHRF